MDRPQWRYFDHEHEFFEDVILTSPRNTSCRDLTLYRRILYAFSMHRKHITFRFSVSESNDGPVSLDYEFNCKRQRKKFYNFIHNNTTFNTLQHDSVRIMINNYFFYFLNDLLSISQRDGHCLLDRICPPLTFKRYYSSIIVSQVIYKEYTRILESGDLTNSFVKDVDNFLSRSFNYLSYSAVSTICKSLRELFPVHQDLLMSLYLKMGGTIYKEVCRELQYLFGRSEETGPVLSIPIDYVSIEKPETDQLPNYTRLKFGTNENLKTRYIRSAEILQEWKLLNVEKLLDSPPGLGLEKHTVDGVEVDISDSNYQRIFDSNQRIISKITQIKCKNLRVSDEAVLQNQNCLYEEVSDDSLVLTITDVPGFHEVLIDESENLETVLEDESGNSEVVLVDESAKADEFAVITPIDLNCPYEITCEQSDNVCADVSVKKTPNDSCHTQIKPQIIPVARVEPNTSKTDGNKNHCVNIRLKKNLIKSQGLKKKPQIKRMKPSRISETLIFKAVTNKLINFMKSDFYKKHLIREEKSKALTALEKKCLLIFLHDNRFLCELHNPMLWEILKIHNFLNRTSIVVYNNFVRDLRANLSREIESIFKNVNDYDLLLSIYDKLRNNFG